jgi:hypothetical protein
MNTRRVPGVTRNSGWHAVDAEIVQARARISHQDEARAEKADPRADGAARQLGKVP